MMNTPIFYTDVPKITLYDPLAEFLGAAEKGVVEYNYVDAVKLAGHSCPTVAGAYLMTRKALASLYGDERPVRGAIQVSFRDRQADEVTGVIANVVGLLTGAAQSGGLKGIFAAILVLFSPIALGEMHKCRLADGSATLRNFRCYERGRTGNQWRGISTITYPTVVCTSFPSWPRSTYAGTKNRSGESIATSRQRDA